MKIGNIDLSSASNTILNICKNGIKGSKDAFTKIGESIKNCKSLNQIKSTLKKNVSAAVNTLKDFFDKSPTISDICNKIGIEHETFQSYPEDFQKFLLANLKDCCDDSATDKIEMLKNIIQDFAAYAKEKTAYTKTDISNEEVNTFLNEIKQQIEELTPEAQKEEKLYKELLLNKELFSTLKSTKSERALAISKLYGGKEISSGDIKLTIDGNPVTIQTKNTPQKLLSGFPDLDDFPGAKDLKQYSSEFQGKKTHHASNLWKQDISFDDKKLSFIRCGNTRGCVQPAKEILANALTLLPSIDKDNDGRDKDHAIALNFSNVQLMTPGRKMLGLTDGDMPSKQMKIFEELANTEQPIELNYQGEKVYVKLDPPLLFNFPTNGQGVLKIFKKLVNFDETNKRNDESFQRLFGNSKDFGGEGPAMIKENGHYVFDKDSIIGKKLNDASLDEHTKAQIQSLADQIIDIYSTDKRGLAKNPAALPTRVALLTNLLGYATSYGCKSGKDRTGTVAIELENLSVKTLTTNTPYDPLQLTSEEQNNLKSIYAAGNSIKMANTSTGGVQNNLKIMRFGGLFTSFEERFGMDLSKDYDKNLEILK